MINIESFNDSLKISWIRRLLTCPDRKWAKLVTSIWPGFCQLLNFGSDYLQRNRNRINSFWSDVLHALSCFMNNIPVVSVEDFLHMSIWFNPEFTINNRSIMFEDMYRRGIFFINDLMKQHGDFLSYNELVELYPNLRVNFLEYAGLINC